jgi:mannose-1-phosphate guanylyltransferase
MQLHAVILAGGRGERFWPLSRRSRPKQVLRLIGEQSLLSATLRRLDGKVPASRTWIVAGVDQKPAILSLDLGISDPQHLWEPVGRNTAPAIGAAAELILSRTSVDAGAGDGEAADPLLLVLPSDHWIADVDGFWRTVEIGKSLVVRDDCLVTFGIPATEPETGYGYLEVGEPIDRAEKTYRAARFHEKPDRETAEAYLRRGGFYWNGGIFLFRARTIARLLREHLPTAAPALDRLRAELQEGPGPEAWSRFFADSPSISIDYGVLERAASVAVVEARFDWSDLGSWTSWAGYQDPDAEGNRCRGRMLAADSGENIVYSGDGGLVALLGVRDLIVVRVGDVTLVCARERAQQVRRLVAQAEADPTLERFL